MPESASGSAIGALRHATAGRHRVLETVLPLATSLSRSLYCDALIGFAVFLGPWEARVTAALPASRRDWFAARSRRPLLQRDLVALRIGDVDPPERRQASLEALDRLELHSVAAAFGSMYVIEGSALGGRVIAKAAHAQLGLGPDSGAAYFNGASQATAQHWKDFCALLEAEVGPTSHARQQACDAAVRTFDALIATFTVPCHDESAA